LRRQIFAELRFKTPAAPYAFHENGLEGEGSRKIQLGHDAISATVAAAMPAASI
jgi:VanZ family protein